MNLATRRTEPSAAVRILVAIVSVLCMLVASGFVASRPLGAESPLTPGQIERGPAGVDGEVARLYMALLDRQPEQKGLEYWVDRRSNGMALTEMVAFFSTSPEFQQTFGSQVDATTEEWVEFMYVEVLERPSEADGKAFWVEQVARGHKTKEDLIIFFADSVEFRVKTRTGMEGLMALVDLSEAAYDPITTYQYDRSFASLVGSSETTITVVDGVVTERAYEESFLNSQGDVVSDSWTETGAELGTHQDGYEPLTVVEVHQKCRDHLVSLDRTRHDLNVRVGSDGRMNRCGGEHRPFIADGDSGDYIYIENFRPLIAE